MRRVVYILFVTLIVFQSISCKKDSASKGKQATVDLNKGIVNFSIDGQVVNAAIDTTYHTISAVVPRNFDQHSLKVKFTLNGQVTAQINNVAVNSGAAVDFTKPVTFTLVTSDKKSAQPFSVSVETDLQYMGVTGNILAEKSLNRSYTYYFDQWDGSQYQAINCGPTSTSMALKWADSTFTGTPAGARAALPESGGWWSTGDVQLYLSQHGINNVADTLGDVAAVVKNAIDNNNALILCLDMFSVPQNGIDYMHTEKFYYTNAASWGHFMLIKGYKQTSTNFYLEAYDPYSDHNIYGSLTPGQLKGQDRYYLDYSIKLATSIWWPYAIIVAPKGQTVTSSHLSINSIHPPIPVAKGQ